MKKKPLAWNCHFARASFIILWKWCPLPFHQKWCLLVRNWRKQTYLLCQIPWRSCKRSTLISVLVCTFSTVNPHVQQTRSAPKCAILKDTALSQPLPRSCHCSTVFFFGAPRVREKRHIVMEQGHCLPFYCTQPRSKNCTGCLPWMLGIEQKMCSVCWVRCNKISWRYISSPLSLILQAAENSILFNMSDGISLVSLQSEV